jgi:orotate phosphoribosyltransferase
MNFISYATLAKDVEAVIPRLPSDIGLVVGVPRSGLIVAIMIAQQLKCPVASLDWPEDYKVSFSKRLRGQELGERVLLVDDSARSGITIRRSLDALKSKIDRPISVLVMYVTAKGIDIIDFYAKKLPACRLFQWNALNHSMLRTSLVDIDGVLCRDPDKAEYSNPKALSSFVETVMPKIKAEYHIMAFVTWRPVTLRGQTVKWLHKHGFKYGKIFFRPEKLTNTAGVAIQTKAHWKANIYKKFKNARLFIESDSDIAKHIFRITKRPVLATDRWKLFR